MLVADQQLFQQEIAAGAGPRRAVAGDRAAVPGARRRLAARAHRAGPVGDHACVGAATNQEVGRDDEHCGAGPRPAPGRQLGVRLRSARFGGVFLLQFALLAWLVGTPARSDFPRRLELTSILIPLSAIAVVTARRTERLALVGLVLAAMAFSGSALSGVRPFDLDIGPGLSVLCSGYTTWLLMRAVVRSPPRHRGRDRRRPRRLHHDGSRVLGGLRRHRIRLPGAFLAAGGSPASFSDLVYFSFVTLLTIGFGDVTPVAPLARALVVFEGLFGVVFTTIVMASLVAGYLRHREGGA